MLDSTRVRFEAECADRIQQLDAREDAVRRSEGMSQRLQEQERALQVSCCCYRRIHIAPHCPYAELDHLESVFSFAFFIYQSTTEHGPSSASQEQAEQVPCQLFCRLFCIE